MGKTFVREKIANERLLKLKKIQDELKKRNIDLIVAFAPGKASFYPEFIPNRFLKTQKGISNYQYFSQQCPKMGINSIDFNKYFREIKDTVSWVIYPKCGIHWSVYGMAICMDSLVRYIEKLRGIEMVQLKWKSLEITPNLRDADDDINNGLNCLWNIPTPSGAYPKFIYIKNDKAIRPSILCIADSFYGTIYRSGVANNIFSLEDFWYYYRETVDRNGTQVNVNSLDLIKEINKHNIVLLLCTEATIDGSFFGFLDDAWTKLFPLKK